MRRRYEMHTLHVQRRDNLGVLEVDTDSIKVGAV
jgi:hypothetical protein